MTPPFHIALLLVLTLSLTAHALDPAPVGVFIFAGQSNMEGADSKVADIDHFPPFAGLAAPQKNVRFAYSLGRENKTTSRGWTDLAPVNNTVGPELSFARTLRQQTRGNIAIAKFTHSGSQMNDWTPEGSMAETRHLYPQFISFIKDSISQLKARGHRVQLAGVFYHIGENDMSMPPYRKQTPDWLKSTIDASRKDLGRPNLHWFVSQQPPTDDERVNEIEVTSRFAALAAADQNTTHIKAFDLPEQPKKLVLDTPAILRLGELLADSYLTK